MTRWTLAGLMALAALGAAAVLDVGSATAEAAPSVSPFAGTYVESGWPAPIAISNRGQIASSYSSPGLSKGSISGSIGADGRYSFTVSVSYEDPDRRGGGPLLKYSYKSAGSMELGADGNILGTPDTGASFVWLRQ
jgi:hypothetical protein